MATGSASSSLDRERQLENSSYSLRAGETLEQPLREIQLRTNLHLKYRERGDPRVLCSLSAPEMMGCYFAFNRQMKVLFAKPSTPKSFLASA